MSQLAIFTSPREWLTNLKPKPQKKEARPLWTVLKEITPVQWALFWSSWLAWTTDAIDFFSVSLSISRLAEQFGKSTSDITTSITLTLLFRSLGAILLGVFSDRFGRKWPLVFNLALVAVLELGAGFVQTYRQFLALRSLFGIAMGGIWGLAASGGLENLPVEARGLASGVLQQGYAVGYLIAAVINLELVPAVPQTWRALFWTAAGISGFAAVLRALIPESAVFIRAKAAEAANGGATKSASEKTKIFFREAKQMLKQHWLLCIYAVLLMTGFNFLSHGSQDLYPTFLEKSKGFDSHSATIATIIGNCGAIVGGAIAGLVSQYAGRRLTIVIFVLLIGVFIPLWILPSGFSPLSAGAFCVQFGVQGAWGVIPIHLAEMSPPAFRATFPGVAYQLGNMVSSASSQIEAVGGANAQITVIQNGKEVVIPNYAQVQGILIGVVAAFVIFLAVIGPENHATHFENAKTAFEEGSGRGELLSEDGHSDDSQVNGSVRDHDGKEQAHIEHIDEKRDEKVAV